MKNCPMEISFSCDIYIYCSRISWVRRMRDTYIYTYGRSGFQFQGQEQIQKFSKEGRATKEPPF